MALHETQTAAERRWIHVNIRLRLRYQLEATFEEYMGLCEQFLGGRARNVGRDEREMREGWVLLRDTWVAAKFDPRIGLIVTVLPTLDNRDPGASQKGALKQQVHVLETQLASEKALRIKAAAQVSQLHNAGHGEVAVYRRDVSWFKELCRRAQSALRRGKLLETYHLLALGAGIARSAHPGSGQVGWSFEPKDQWAPPFFADVESAVRENPDVIRSRAPLTLGVYPCPGACAACRRIHCTSTLGHSGNCDCGDHGGAP